MNPTFKTPQIERFIRFLISQNPEFRTVIESFIPKLSMIDLSVHLKFEETFQLPIYLANGESIPLVWNIDSLIKHILKNDLPIYKAAPDDILNTPGFHFNTQAFLELMNVVKKNRSNSFSYKTNFIIITALPVFDGFAIIDGNHRFCHALSSHIPNINFCLIPPEISLLYLQPESQNFIRIMEDINLQLI